MSNEAIRRELARNPELLAQVEKMLASKSELSDSDLEQITGGKGGNGPAAGGGGGRLNKSASGGGGGRRR